MFLSCNQNVSNAVDGLLLNDLLLVQKENNLTLPAWTDSVFPEKLLLIAEKGLKVRTQTPYLKLVRGGPMVSRIFNQMLHKQNRKTPNRSIYIYSGHDATLMSVMRLLNLNSQTARKPHYGATLAFELHCSTNGDCGQFEVRVSFHAKLAIILIRWFTVLSSQQILYYPRFDSEKPKQLVIPNCPAPCTLDQFAKSINEILTNDYIRTCDPNNIGAISCTNFWLYFIWRCR